MNILKFSQVNDKIISIRNQRVILDSDVAALYGVETRDINKSVKNNPEKFPDGYVLELDKKEFSDLRWNISTANITKTRVLPKAFTKKGCYMLATILKSEKATETTIAIIEAFDKLSELQETVAELSKAPDEFQQKTLMQKGGEIFSELIGDSLQVTDTETTIEINFALMKFKHTVRKKKEE
jgi:phage regulator Rha-like protein